MTLGEGATPLEAAPAVAHAIGLDALLFKREDQNPTGSHKDRGVAFQVSLARAAFTAAHRPLARIALSSSGNAAISAATYGRLASIDVVAFVAPDTAPAKLALLRGLGAIVVASPNALSLCQAWCTLRGVPNLRPSTDPSAVEGFKTLGWEILAGLAALDAPRGREFEAVFTFVSSATSLVGIGRAFALPNVVARTGPPPSLHAVQGVGGASVAGPLDARPQPDGPRLAGRLGALGARKTRRLGEAYRLIAAGGGAGWAVTEAEAEFADALLRREGITVSIEGAASLAAARRAAAERGVRRAIVVLTGAERGAVPGGDTPFGTRHGLNVDWARAATAEASEHGLAGAIAETIDAVDALLARHAAESVR